MSKHLHAILDTSNSMRDRIISIQNLFLFANGATIKYLLTESAYYLEYTKLYFRVNIVSLLS